MRKWVVILLFLLCSIDFYAEELNILGFSFDRYPAISAILLPTESDVNYVRIDGVPRNIESVPLAISRKQVAIGILYQDNISTVFLEELVEDLSESFFVEPLFTLWDYSNEFSLVLPATSQKFVKPNLNSETIYHSDPSRTKLLDSICAVTSYLKNIVWKDKYIFTEKSINIKGMLFIYNHDNAYDQDFMELFKKATEKISIDKGNIISVIGPKKILYLANIAANIKTLRGEKQLTDEEYGFFYPEQPVRKIYHDQSRLPLTVEQIGGSFHVLRYSSNVMTTITNGLDVYLEDKQCELENFQHLFDYLRKYNCLQSFNRIRIFAPFPRESTHTNYDKALRIYGETVDENFAKKITPMISYVHMNRITPQFFSQEIGMRDE